MSFVKFTGAMLLAAAIVVVTATVSFVPTASAFSIKASVTAKNVAEARKKGWNIIKKTRKFKKWASGVRHTSKAWKGHKCVTLVFVGGNGKVWYVYIDHTKRGRKYSVRARNTPLRSDCKKHS